jgi:hypothetical protein
MIVGTLLRLGEQQTPHDLGEDHEQGSDSAWPGWRGGVCARWDWCGGEVGRPTAQQMLLGCGGHDREGSSLSGDKNPPRS